jgi:hypothetical protein
MQDVALAYRELHVAKLLMSIGTACHSSREGLRTAICCF